MLKKRFTQPRRGKAATELARRIDAPADLTLIVGKNLGFTPIIKNEILQIPGIVDVRGRTSFDYTNDRSEDDSTDVDWWPTDERPTPIITIGPRLENQGVIPEI